MQCPSPYWSTPLTPEDRRINGSVLDNGNSYTSGRHASLLATGSRAMHQEATQLREGLLTGTLTGQKINYLDSGYSEEDADQQVTSCLMKTSSGSIYIPPNMPKNPTMDSRQEYRFGHSSSSPSHSPTKESLKNSERSTLQYTTSDTPFLPMRNNLQQKSGTLGASRSGHHFTEKNFARKCSWRCIAIFFVVLAVILSAALAYVTASSFLPVSYESAKACAVVVDDSPTNSNLETSSPARSMVQSLEPVADAKDSEKPRNLPPDGTTFRQISLGPKQRLSQNIPAYGYWNVQFYQMEAAYVHFDLWLPRGASLGFYARRNALPTHTNYDLMEVIKGANTELKAKRSVQRTVEKRLSLFLREGHWFVSLYNDFGDAQSVDLVAALSLEMTEGCPNGCNGHGECVLGRCQCEMGYGGEDCSQGACPLLCGGHGDYKNGECICHPGWKGKECSLRHDECEVADCSGRGRCSEGHCQCIKGFTGEFCEKVDCPDPSCAGHGFCVDGACICKKGWKGQDCATLDEEARQCLPDCSGNGFFDLEAQQCQCNEGWVGEDCSSRLCNLDCGPHGRCEDTACVCQAGWQGHRCQEKDCDSRCSLHGQCKNGTCLCVSGWNGLHCTLEGCPGGCSNHGGCKANFKGEWSCHCHPGWEGPDCSVRLETRCNDGYDDDQDGLIDCQDPECCEASECKSSQLCATVARPIDILLQRQPPASTASFFQKMRFIIEEGSLQRYAKNTAFNESRAAVLRGRVVTASGRGLVGVRVTHADIHTEGYTMTQEDGWFDFMVNGGGAVTLTFGKSPFPPQVRNLFVPWNEVVVIDNVIMSMNNFAGNVTYGSSGTCQSHDYESMKPIMVASWRLGSQNPSRSLSSGIITETRVLQEVLPVPNSNVKLVYHSGRARGYLSTIELRLTPKVIPETLKAIHLRITIEGVLFEKTFEADPSLKYTYSWNRLNIYRQRVYGTTTAVVKVGYEYEDCNDVIWDVQTAKITGQDLTVSDVGGWDVDIHHRYNPQEGILYKGDGSNVFLRERPRLIYDVMGDGTQRALECRDETCHRGQALEQRLLSPVAIVSGSDGSIYVGDFNLIRRIMPDGLVKTLLKLPSSGVAYRYHMTLNPHDDVLYISNAESHQVIKILNMLEPSDIENNFQVVIGNGVRCLPGDLDQCGDGGHALQARLTYPKGIAITADNRIYIADGTTIRLVDEDGIIQTVIGHDKGRSWKPIVCHGTTRLEDVSLRWPSDLAINPLDNSLHFIDDNTVLKITADDQVEIVAGKPLHCQRIIEDRDLASFAAKSSLVSPQSLDFAGNGDMFLAESDGRRINRISRVSTDGRIKFFAGRDSKCNCQDAECPCFDSSVLLASESVFGSISSLAIGPDSSVIVADESNRRIRTIQSSIPELIQKSQEYEVYSPETNEVYVFNRFGLHTETRNIPSGRSIFKFSYSVSTSNGKLVGISDANGNKLKIIRDYAGQATAIENPLRQSFELRLDRKRMLTQFSNENNTVVFGYTRSSELIQSKMTSEKANFVYDYDANGRLDSIVLPTGDLLKLSNDLDLRGSLVNVTLNGDYNIISIRMRPGTVQDLINGVSIDVSSDRGFVKTTDSGQSFTLNTRPYELINDNQGLAESFPVPTSERTDIGRDTVSALEWQYFKTKQRSGKRLKINGETMMTVELNRATQSQIMMLESTQAMLNVSESRISMMPSGLFSSVILDKSSTGLPKAWRWGDLEMTYDYDRNNRLASLTKGQNSKTSYLYKGNSFVPEKVTIASGGSFVFSRNDLGGLEYIMTPRGHIHGTSSQMSLSLQKYTYSPPWTRQPYELHYDFSGKLLAWTLPEQAGKVIYNYDKDHGSRLDSIFGDSRSIDYDYYPGSNLIKNIQVSEEDVFFGMNQGMIYHYGLLKEITTNFKTNKDLILDDINVKFTYDGSARLGGITTQIGQHEPEVIMIKYNSKSARLEGIKDLRFRQESLRKTVVQDITQSYSLTRDLDSYGRLEEIVIRINGYEQYRLKLEYLSNLNMISAKSITLAKGSPISEAYEYTQDLSLKQVKSEVGQDWTYEHDINGNIVNVKRGEKITAYIIDGGDRIAMVNSQEYVTYDERGFVVKRGETNYNYNVFGQMTSAYESGRFSIRFYYDDIGRIIAKRDHRGNVVQFVYANPYANSSVTHVHYPKADRTYHMIYDEDSGHLIAMDTPDSRFYIGTDHIGSPMAVFDSKGRLVKEILRSPFGQVIRDSNPAMDLSIDYAGGLIDQYTHLVHIGQRVYDPVLGQWMTPDWMKVATPGAMKTPHDVFSYRFNQNDPVNMKKDTSLMSDMSDWLQMFGLNMNRLMGSSYTSQSHHTPHLQSSVTSSTFSMSVGLMNQQAESEENLQRPNLLKSLNSLSLSPQDLSPSLNTHLNSKSSSFGQGMLVSDLKGRAMVTIVSNQGQSDVIQSVLASVLNASAILEASHGGREEFYFLKEFGFETDLNELQRLSGTYNISTEAGIRNNAEAKVLCAQNRASTICIMYGIEKRAANRWALKKAYKESVAAAWRKEVNAVKSGFNGFNHEWSSSQKAELVSMGEVRGHQGIEVHNVHKYPALIGQSSNIRFVPEAEARGWHSNLRKRKH